MDKIPFLNMKTPYWELQNEWTKNITREQLQKYLQTNGIGTLIHYPVPPHLQPAYQELGLPVGSFPITERIHAEVLSLPMGPHLSMMELERVVDVIQAYFAEYKG